MAFTVFVIVVKNGPPRPLAPQTDLSRDSFACDPKQGSIIFFKKFFLKPFNNYMRFHL